MILYFCWLNIFLKLIIILLLNVLGVDLNDSSKKIIKVAFGSLLQMILQSYECFCYDILTTDSFFYLYKYS